MNLLGRTTVPIAPEDTPEGKEEAGRNAPKTELVGWEVGAAVGGQDVVRDASCCRFGKLAAVMHHGRQTRLGFC